MKPVGTIAGTIVSQPSVITEAHHFETVDCVLGSGNDKVTYTGIL